MAVTIVPKDEMVNAVGTKFEPGEWIEVSQERINTFADCTEDHQFIHIDEEKAAQTPFGGTIAHGFLTLSLLAKLVEGNGIVEHSGRGLYLRDVPRANALIKRSGAVKYQASISKASRIPLRQALVECICTVEHGFHCLYSRHTPRIELLIK